MDEERLESPVDGGAAPGTGRITQRWAACLLTALPLLVSLAWLGGTLNRAYGPTHYFLNYRHGFLKRALVGQVLSPLHFIGMRQILVIELAVFALLVAATYAVFRHMLFGSIEQRSLAVFLLAAPAVLPHFAYLSGDLDSFLYLLTVLAVGALLSLPSGFALLGTLALSLVALLIHEGFVLLFYPLLLAVMLDLVRRKRMRASLVILQLAVVAAVFLAVLHYGKWAVPHPEYMAAAQQRTDIPLEGTVFLVLASTLQQQLHFVAGLYRPNLVIGILLSGLVSLPYLGLLAWLMQRSLALRGYAVGQRRALLLLLASPLLLCALGHDVMRWVAAIGVNLSLFLLYLYSSAAEGSNERHTLTAWTATPLYAAMLGYVLALGPFGIASNRLVTNVGQLLSGKHDGVQRLRLESTHAGFGSTGLQRALLPPANETE